MDMARQFIASGAFPKITPEQAFTIMKAGEEMGMKPIESLNSLYIVNGTIQPYGKALTAKLRQDGFEIEYSNETHSGVTVTVTKGDFKAVETVTDEDEIIKNSRAAKFAKKNKLRYHALRMIINFHLADLFTGVGDLYQADFVDFDKATFDQLGYIETLLPTAAIPDDRKEAIEKDLHNYTSAGASEAIRYLKENQIPLAWSGTGTQTQRAAEIRDIIDKE